MIVKFILYAVLVSILCTTASWGRMQPGSAGDIARSGGGSGSSWSSRTGGGSWGAGGGGGSGGGHK